MRFTEGFVDCSTYSWMLEWVEVKVVPGAAGAFQFPRSYSAEKYTSAMYVVFTNVGLS